jgi:sugar phosphate isomerase/epimerase
LYENIEELINRTQKTLICFENYALNAVVMNVFDRIFRENGNLYLTLDIAKLYNKNFEIIQKDYEYMTERGERIREIHIHDVNPQYGGHQSVGSGIVDFKKFEKFLFREDIFMNFEVRPPEAAKLSKQTLFETFGKKDK